MCMKERPSSQECGEPEDGREMRLENSQGPGHQGLLTRDAESSKDES